MLPAGLAIELDEDRLGVRRHRALEAADIVGIGPHHVPAEALEGVGELVDRAAIEFSRGDEFVAGHQQLLQHDDLRGVARGHRQRGGAAFERRDALFQHRVGRIADAGIDVAERLQPEQRGGVVGVVEHERRGLIDRRRPRAGGGIGLRAGMHGKGRKSRKTIGHSVRPVVFGSEIARHADGSRVRRQGGAGSRQHRVVEERRRCFAIAAFSKQSFRNCVSEGRSCFSRRGRRPRSRRRRRSSG